MRISPLHNLAVKAFDGGPSLKDKAKDLYNDIVRDPDDRKQLINFGVRFGACSLSTVLLTHAGVVTAASNPELSAQFSNFAGIVGGPLQVLTLTPPTLKYSVKRVKKTLNEHVFNPAMDRISRPLAAKLDAQAEQIKSLQAANADLSSKLDKILDGQQQFLASRQAKSKVYDEKPQASA